MKAAINYFKNRKDAIGVLLEKPQRAYSPATFHKLRVEIKKLNAFLELIEFCSNDFKRKKIVKPFKQIFHQAGMVRELQVEEAMLKKYFRDNLLQDFRKSLKKVRLKEQRNFFSIANNKFVARLKIKFGKIVPFLLHVDKKKVNRYMKKERRKIEKLLSPKTFNSQEVHFLRKRLKNYYYNRKALDLEKQNELVRKDVLTEILGKWNDCQVILRHLGEAVDSVGINPKEMGQLKKIKAKTFSDSEILFNKINLAIPESEFFQSSGMEIKFTKKTFIG